jgi:microsomal dipeptidase-like Zn-dependent dipeptidase
MRTARARVLALGVSLAVLITAPAARGAMGASGRSVAGPPAVDAAAQAAAAPWVEPGTTRAAVPANQYDPAGGCYVAKSIATHKYVVRAGASFAATGTSQSAAEPFHFQAFDLGKYLLFATQRDFLAADRADLSASARKAADIAQRRARGTGDETLKPVRDPALQGVNAGKSAADQAAAPANKAVGSDGVVAAKHPSGDAEWVLRKASSGFIFELPVDDQDEADPGPVDPPIAGTLTAATTGRLVVSPFRNTTRAAQFTLARSTGCASWPEIGTQIYGPPAHGATAYQETQGYLDGHLHGMAFEFLGGKAHCGRPWHPYGVTYALVDCPDHKPGGKGAILEQVLSGGNPVEGHDTVGWPTFGYWPHYDSLTHEQTYYTWLERAWRGGLRMFTNLLVENGVLCEIYPYKRNSCNEMDAVRLQAKRLRQLERYIDAQSGGPGKGWFRIVTDPFQARRIINAGKLAVVMGIEVSVPFDCGEYLGRSRCTAADIDRRLNEVYSLGVRQMELTNKFDNALTGVTGDSGALGPAINSGNKYETGHYWKMQTCSLQSIKVDETDKTQYDVADETGTGDHIHRDSIFGGVLQVFGGTGLTPVYPSAPHCNAIGLTDLGRNALSGLMKRGMIFDPDHMSASARHASLDYVTAAGYSGVISSHSWADDSTYQRILALGGVVTPHAGSSASFVEQWKKLRGWKDPRFVFGLGYGSDVNGFSAQGAPRNPTAGSGVHYPITGLGGVTIQRQVSGKQTFDVNTDGVDHYGLYPDWVEDGRLVADALGNQFTADIRRGPEAYLQMWERAVGIRPNSCRSDVADLTSSQLNKVKRGMPAEAVLAALGQPNQRHGRTFTYCATTGSAIVTFDSTGRVA